MLMSSGTVDTKLEYGLLDTSSDIASDFKRIEKMNLAKWLHKAYFQEMLICEWYQSIQEQKHNILKSSQSS